MFEVRHVRGTQNIVVDTFSGMLDSPNSDSANQFESHLVLTEFPPAFQQLAQLQREDPPLASIMTQLESVIWLKFTFSLRAIVLSPQKRGDQKIVVPTAAIAMIFSYFHETQLGGHLGVFKTQRTIISEFIWKGMDKDITFKCSWMSVWCSQ